MSVDWQTTAPHPWKKAHRCGEDQNQVGWRVHAVENGVALCGLRPRHGWAYDLFIEEPCARCYAAAEARKLPIPPDCVAAHKNKMRVRREIQRSFDSKGTS